MLENINKDGSYLCIEMLKPCTWTFFGDTLINDDSDLYIFKLNTSSFNSPSKDSLK